MTAREPLPAPRPEPAAPPAGVDRPQVRLASVALPAEHGGWGMLGEPLLLGLLVAPSWPALGLGVFAVFAFLARHPLKLAIADARRGRTALRTTAAWRFAAAYTLLAVAGLVLALRAPGSWWIPVALAAPLALAQLRRDVRNEGRGLLPELLGSVALGSIAAAELLAGGWTLAASLAAWALVGARAAGSVLYVRARLRADRGQPHDRAATLAAHVFGLLLAAGLAAVRLGPWLAIPVFALLLARAALGLSRFRRRVRPQVVGITELGWGLAFVLLLAFGYRGGI